MPSTTSGCSATVRRRGCSSTAPGAKACCLRSTPCPRPSARRRSPPTRPSPPRSASSGRTRLSRFRPRARAGALRSRRSTPRPSPPGSMAAACRPPPAWYSTTAAAGLRRGAAQVSACRLHTSPAGTASRARQGDGRPGDGEGVLTWPEGNGWLTQGWRRPLGERLLPRRVALRIREGRSEVEVDVWKAGCSGRALDCAAVVVGTPLFVAALCSPRRARPARGGRAMRYAPWMVANLQLDAALDDRPARRRLGQRAVRGAPRLCRCEHQSTRRSPADRAHLLGVGGNDRPSRRPARSPAERMGALGRRVVADLTAMHPDCPPSCAASSVRYGHAIAHPDAPGRAQRGAAGARRDAEADPLRPFDLSAYSVFEEALPRHAAGSAAAHLRSARGGRRAGDTIRHRNRSTASAP